MEYSICPDEDTLDFNGSGELELVYDSEFFDLTADGLAYKNNLAYRRSFTPVLYSNATPMTMGASTMVGTYARCRFGSGYENFFGDASVLWDFYLTFFDWHLTFGAGFSVPAGTLNWRDSGGILEVPKPIFASTYIPGVGIVGNAKFIDASTPANNAVRILGAPYGMDDVNMRDYTGANVTDTSVFTFASGDQILVSGWCLSLIERDAVLT